MITYRSRSQGLMFVLLALCVVGAIAALRTTPTSHAADAKGARLKSLLQERLTTVRDVANTTNLMHRQGMVTSAQAYEANAAVFNAELDLSETNAQRVAILDKMLVEAKAYEDTMARSAASTAIDRNAPLLAKVSRLDVEIALERARTAK
jgi:hypothetical protein